MGFILGWNNGLAYSINKTKQAKVFPISAIYRHVTPWLLMGGSGTLPWEPQNSQHLLPDIKKKSMVFLLSKLIQSEREQSFPNGLAKPAAHAITDHTR